jgi:hypothetical protein
MSVDAGTPSAVRSDSGTTDQYVITGGADGKWRLNLLAEADIARASLDYIGTLTPIQEIAERPELREKLTAVKQSIDDAAPPSIPGPGRAQLLEFLG